MMKTPNEGEAKALLATERIPKRKLLLLLTKSRNTAFSHRLNGRPKHEVRVGFRSFRHVES